MSDTYYRDVDKVIEKYAEAKLNFLLNLTRMSLILNKEDWDYTHSEFTNYLNNSIEFCIRIVDINEL